ncbi:unnamed protein product [Somion occarium]|uniref:Uncharacterized protein n=1 Tax=Somion occarium TaxID=3059160 RepID=A0ABP1DIG5_9APHY
MATSEIVNFNDPHPPTIKGIEAFKHVEKDIKTGIIKSRHHWDKHEPKMWSRADGLSDHDLVHFDLEKDLVEIRSAPVSYGTIILGKLRLPAVNDEEGEGFVHVRVHDPPNRGTEDVTFHSLFTNEGDHDADGHPHSWKAVKHQGPI